MIDPIFAAIDRHRHADAQWAAFNQEANRLAPGFDPSAPFAKPASNDNTGNEYHSKAAIAEAQWNVAAHAANNLFLIEPTTLAGVLALLRYIAEREASSDTLLELSALPGPYPRASVALCHRLIDALELIERRT